MMTMARRGVAAALMTATLIAGAPGLAQAPATQAAGQGERTFWYFYRVKWGFQEEFERLFRKNHYPVLKAQLGGRIVAINTYVPTFHGDGRADWTFAVVLTFRDMAAFLDSSSQPALIRKLYPDQETFVREEQRRFEILDAHWDVALNEVSMDGR